MSLKSARIIARKHQRSNPEARVYIRRSPEACKAHNPNRHPMEGAYIVELHAGGTTRIVWE
jgi:hypothetical protein